MYLLENFRKLEIPMTAGKRFFHNSDGFIFLGRDGFIVLGRDSFIVLGSVSLLLIVTFNKITILTKILRIISSIFGTTMTAGKRFRLNREGFIVLHRDGFIVLHREGFIVLGRDGFIVLGRVSLLLIICFFTKKNKFIKRSLNNLKFFGTILTV